MMDCRASRCTPSRRFRLLQLLVFVALLGVGCATRQARIGEQQELFDSYPPDIQAQIREGRIDVGFTNDMVHMALGSPDSVRRRVDSEGETVLWVYRSLRPSMSVGIGGGTYGGFGGVGIQDAGELRDETVVTLEQGIVVEVEYVE